MTGAGSRKGRLIAAALAFLLALPHAVATHAAQLRPTLPSESLIDLSAVGLDIGTGEEKLELLIGEAAGSAAFLANLSEEIANAADLDRWEPTGVSDKVALRELGTAVYHVKESTEGLERVLAPYQRVEGAKVTFQFERRQANDDGVDAFFARVASLLGLLSGPGDVFTYALLVLGITSLGMLFRRKA